MESENMNQKIKISKLDSDFSRYIRSRDGWKCQRCQKQYRPPTNGLHCSHFYGRARKSVRFDLENCCALCHGCHSFFTANPELHRQFFFKRLGEKRYNALMIRANTPKKPDREIIRIWLEHELETMEKE